MRHTVQAISTTPTAPRIVLDVSGEPASLPLSTAVQSVGDTRYLLASAVSAYMLTLLNDPDAATAFATLGGSSGAGWMRLPGGLIIQWGTNVVTTNAGGGAGITLPTGFSSTTSYRYISWNGDDASGNIIHAAVPASQGTGSFGVRVKTANTGAVLASANVRIDWIAVGT